MVDLDEVHTNKLLGELGRRGADPNYESPLSPKEVGDYQVLNVGALVEQCLRENSNDRITNDQLYEIAEEHCIGENEEPDLRRARECVFTYFSFDKANKILPLDERNLVDLDQVGKIVSDCLYARQRKGLPLRSKLFHIFYGKDIETLPSEPLEEKMSSQSPPKSNGGLFGRVVDKYAPKQLADGYHSATEFLRDAVGGLFKSSTKR